jgi:cytochrome c-type biogenesis protein CcmH
MDFFVARYGEFVLMTPRGSGSNVLLWAAGPAMLLMALIIGFYYLRGRESANAPQDAALTAEETERLREIMKD